MNKVVDYLQQLDLSKIEAKLYLSLLKVGPISIRELAETTNIKRTTAYFHIDLLVEKGLVIKVIRGSRKIIAANKPEEGLKNLVEKKYNTALQTKSDFPIMIKKINSVFPQFKDVGEAEIKYYKGIYNVNKIYQEAFDGNEVRSYVKVEEVPLISSDNALYFNEALKHNRKLKMWEVIYESPVSRRQVIKLLAQKNPGYFCKFMPANLNWSTSEDILIYDGKVAIINYKSKVSSIVLESPTFYNNLKEIFDFIWRIIPDVN